MCRHEQRRKKKPYIFYVLIRFLKFYFEKNTTRNAGQNSQWRKTPYKTQDKILNGEKHHTKRRTKSSTEKNTTRSAGQNPQRRKTPHEAQDKILNGEKRPIS
ncbi:MAG: hypothetical protein NW226_05895 [Microscillaceae bacterium]|nr:hypothetical protein [Microscillaceae bacterium]